MAKLPTVKGHVSAELVRLQSRLNEALSGGASLRELSEMTGLTETTLASVRDGERQQRRKDTLDGLRRLPAASSDGKLAEGQSQVGAAASRTVRVEGGVVFTGSATVSTFRTERERLLVAQQAARTAERYHRLLGAELADLVAALSAPVQAADFAQAVAQGAPSVSQTASQTLDGTQG